MIEYRDGFWEFSRKPLLHIAASFDAETKRAFKKTIEINRLIDSLRETEFQNVSATHETWYCTLPLAGSKGKNCARQEAVGTHVASSFRLTLCFMCYFGVTDGTGSNWERLSFQCSILAASRCKGGPMLFGWGESKFTFRSYCIELDTKEKNEMKERQLQCCSPAWIMVLLHLQVGLSLCVILKRASGELEGPKDYCLLGIVNALNRWGLVGLHLSPSESSP